MTLGRASPLLLLASADGGDCRDGGEGRSGSGGGSAALAVVDLVVGARLDERETG